MMISKHFFHVLSFVLFLTFSFSSAHFHDVTPFEDFDSKSSDSSSAPSPYPASVKTPTTTAHSSGGAISFQSSVGFGDVTGSGGSDPSKGSCSLPGSGNSMPCGSPMPSDSSSGFGSLSGSSTTSDSSSSSGSDFSMSLGGSGSISSDNAPDSEENNVDLNFSGSFSKVFAFGDSYTDTGNAKLLGIVKEFVGALLARIFQGANSNIKLGSRPTNGRLVVDFLTDALNISTLQPYKAITANAAGSGNSGVNFAIGGATSLAGDFFANLRVGHNLLWKGIPLGFQTQVEWFNKFLSEIACNGKSEEECKTELGNNLIWLGQMGADDFARVLGSSISLRWLTDQTIGHISKILTTVLDSGAKFVVVQGLPPVGCWPLAKQLTPQFLKDEMGCSAVINKAVIAHNELLQKTLEEFRKKHGSNVVIAYADFFNAFKTIVGNLTGFGFADGSKACCGVGGGLLNFNLHNLCGMAGTKICANPNGHIHWDGLHLTEGMHRHITHLLLHKGFCKPSFAHVIRMRRLLRKPLLLGLKTLIH